LESINPSQSSFSPSVFFPSIVVCTPVERKSLDERLCESVRALTEQSEAEDKRLAVTDICTLCLVVLFDSITVSLCFNSFCLSLFLHLLIIMSLSISMFLSLSLFSLPHVPSLACICLHPLPLFSSLSSPHSYFTPHQSEIAATNHALAESNIVRTQEVNRLDALIGQNETERQREDKRLDEQHRALVDVVENSVKPAHAALMARVDATELQFPNLWQRIGSTLWVFRVG
jgi:hypothetical protein